MMRRIIRIDTKSCTGCGRCAEACHEGAIKMVNGRAALMTESYCDGLGDCLPACPAGAISFEYREAPAYDAAAVRRSKAAAGDCPAVAMDALNAFLPEASGARSALMQWPCQLKLMPLSAPFYENGDLLVAADCAAYACAFFHERFMRGRITVIGCPKLDGAGYAEKLTAMLSGSTLRTVTLVKMQVPCCGGLERAVLEAVRDCGRDVPVSVVTLSLNGQVLNG